MQSMQEHGIVLNRYLKKKVYLEDFIVELLLHCLEVGVCITFVAMHILMRFLLF